MRYAIARKDANVRRQTIYAKMNGRFWAEPAAEWLKESFAGKLRDTTAARQHLPKGICFRTSTVHKVLYALTAVVLNYIMEKDVKKDAKIYAEKC